MDPTAGRIALVSGIVGAVAVVFLIPLLRIVPRDAAHGARQAFGTLNDVCVALQYLLAVPVALSLRRILEPQAPTLIRVTTILGTASMLAVVALQTALVVGVVTFQQQVLWVSLAMIVGVGAWLVITGVVARSTGRFPNSLRMSLLAVPYLFYPVWAYWLGKHLLRS